MFCLRIGQVPANVPPAIAENLVSLRPSRSPGACPARMPVPKCPEMKCPEMGVPGGWVSSGGGCPQEVPVSPRGAFPKRCLSPGDGCPQEVSREMGGEVGAEMGVPVRWVSPAITGDVPRRWVPEEMGVLGGWGAEAPCMPIHKSL